MIKNISAGLLAASLGLGDCAPEVTTPPGAWQGIVELEERVLPFEVPGRVEAIAVEEGDRVAADQVLARLDDRLEEIALEGRLAELSAAEAELALLEAGALPEDVRAVRAELRAAKSAEAQAQRTLGRTENLVGRGAASQADLDEARAGWEQAVARRQDLRARLARTRHGARTQEIEAARARVDAARAAVATSKERLRRHVLAADAEATVLTVHLEPHELAAVGTPVVTVADTARPYVDVFVPQGRIGEVELGAAAEVHVDAYDEPFHAVVEHIARRTEFTPKFLFSERERPNLVIRVRMRIDDPERKLHAGVPGFVTLAKGPAAG